MNNLKTRIVLSTKCKIIWKFSISGCCNFWVIYKTWFSLEIDMEGFLCSLLIKTGLYSWKHTLIEYETFRSYSEHLSKTFILTCATVTDSDKVISWNKSEKRSRWRLKRLGSEPRICFRENQNKVKEPLLKLLCRGKNFR